MPDNLTQDQISAARYFISAKTSWLAKLMRNHLVAIGKIQPLYGEDKQNWDMSEMIRDSYAETIRCAALLGVTQAEVDSEITLWLGQPFDMKLVKRAGGQ